MKSWLGPSVPMFFNCSGLRVRTNSLSLSMFTGGWPRVRPRYWPYTTTSTASLEWLTRWLPGHRIAARPVADRPVPWCLMPGPSATPIALSARQRALLQSLDKRQTASTRLARRVAVLLALDAGPRLTAVAHSLGLTRLTVRHWRDR